MHLSKQESLYMSFLWIAPPTFHNVHLPIMFWNDFLKRTWYFQSDEAWLLQEERGTCVRSSWGGRGCVVAEGWIGGCVATGAPQQCTPVGGAGKMQLGHEWEQHLFILIFLLQPELAFSPGVVEWVDGLLPLSFLDTGAVAGECEPLGTWTRSRGVQGWPSREAGEG